MFPVRPRRDAGWLAGPRRAGARGRAATAAVAVAVAVTGCAAVPTSGAVQQFGGAAQNGPAGPGGSAQPVPEPPGQGWTPQEIVLGFLSASASFANNHAVAREYLDPSAESDWKPSWAVTVVSSAGQGTPVPEMKQFVANEHGGPTMRVVVYGQQVATVADTGQFLATAESHKTSATFDLTKNSEGQWRIIAPLPANLLISQQDFQRVYQSRDIYFLGGSGQTLVPDPVFVPEEDTNAQLATGLANALLKDPKGWLQGAVTTAFPHGVSAEVKINGPNATVDLVGKGATANRRQQQQMAAQLTWTLASGPIQSVELEINGRPLQIGGNQIQLQGSYTDWLPVPTPGSSLYYVGTGGTVRALSGVGPPGSGDLGNVSTVTTPRVPPLRSIAVSPNGRWIAGISQNQKVVYAWEIGNAGTLRRWAAETGDCSSLSWDSAGDLWITAGGGLWMMAPGSDGAQSVTLPSNDTAVTDFRVAPDGVRAVMIVNNGTQLQLVAIIHAGQSPSLGDPVTIGPGVGDPEAVSWYDADDVFVLADSSSGGELEEIPLTSGQPIWTASEGNIASMTATYPSGTNPNVAVGLSDGQVIVSTNLGAFHSTAAKGQAPAFPG
jgi:Lipoprotein LpqB beta-propeller domain/Sporulation and spore germination